MVKFNERSYFDTIGGPLHLSHPVKFCPSVMKQVIEKYNEEGIPTYGELIWPMPEETVESFRDNIQKYFDLNQDSFFTSKSFSHRRQW